MPVPDEPPLVIADRTHEHAPPFFSKPSIAGDAEAFGTGFSCAVYFTSGPDPGFMLRLQEGYRVSIYDYHDYRQFIRDRVELFRERNGNLSIREVLRRVKCSSPSYYKEVVVDARKNMSASTARRFAAFLRLTTEETEYFVLMMNYNQARTEMEKLLCYEKLLLHKRKPAGDSHFLNIGEYEYMAEWHHTVIRELLPLFDGFGNRNAAERAALSQKLRVKITDRQIDEAIELLEKLKFIRKNARGNYIKTEATIKTGTKTPAAFRTLCQFTDLGKNIINNTDPLYRFFKIAVLGLTGEMSPIIEKKINEACEEIVSVAGSATNAPDRLYAMSIQFFPLTRLPEER